MVLDSDDVLTEGEDKRPVSIPTGTAGGKLSSRRSRAIVEEICKNLEVLRKDTTVPVLETCVDIVERALKDAQGRAVPKEHAGKQTLSEDDGISGLPCAACRNVLRPGEVAVPAKPKDETGGAVSWIHAACAVEAANNG